MPDITMPKLSDTMEEGKILRWRKHPGDTVSVGEILVEVETDKADMEIEADQEGVLREIRLQEGEAGPVGTVIAVLDEAGARSAAAAPSRAEAPAAKPSRTAPPPPRPAPPSRPWRDLAPTAPAPSASEAVAETKVSPLARTRAAELGIDPTRLKGSGPGGRVTRKDVEDAHRTGGDAGKPPSAVEVAPEPPPVEPPEPGAPGSGTVTVRPPALDRVSIRPPSPGTVDVTRVPLTGMRASIARRMTESKREAPHFYVTTIARMDRAVELREGLKASGGLAARVTYNHLILKACADALTAHRELNSRFAGDAIEILPEVNLGVATAVPEGLIVPVIHRADQKSVLEIAAEARSLAEKARDRSFSSAELSGATFSVSNLGMYDVESFVAVINPPQAAILAVGSVAARPVVREGTLAVGHTVHLTLSCDHRAVDGARAAEFLSDVRARLESPVRLLVPQADAGEG